jgi:hypothetical protein
MKIFAACSGKSHGSQSPTNFAVVLKLCTKNPIFRAAKSNQCFAGQFQRQAKASSDSLNAAFA